MPETGASAPIPSPAFHPRCAPQAAGRLGHARDIVPRPCGLSGNDHREDRQRQQRHDDEDDRNDSRPRALRPDAPETPSFDGGAFSHVFPIGLPDWAIPAILVTRDHPKTFIAKGWAGIKIHSRGFDELQATVRRAVQR